MYVNTAIQEHRQNADNLHPYDIFDSVAGTSTGGLIAIMIGKLGMTLEECIQAYYELSGIIFGRKQFIGMLTYGVGPEKWSKYSGRDLENLINARLRKKRSRFGERTTMIPAGESNDRTAWERVNGSYSRACRPGPVLICNHVCDEMIECLVSQAARATSAAPTYFPPQTIGERILVDGAMGYNNPSFETYYHYTRWNRVASSRGRSQAAGAGPPDRCHGGIDWSRMRLVNLGTGNKSEGEQPHQRDNRKGRPQRWKWARELIGIAFDTQDVIKVMEVLDSEAAHVMYERFSAGHELSIIKMDDHESLDEINRLTEAYLGDSSTQENLKRVAEEIASEYLQRHEDRYPVPAISVTSAAPVAGPASPMEAIHVNDTTYLINTTPPDNMAAVNNVPSSSNVVPALGAPTIADMSPTLDRDPDVDTEPAISVFTTADSETSLIRTPRSSRLPDLVRSSGLTTRPSASTAMRTSPRTPTSSRSRRERFKAFIQYRLRSPLQLKSKNRGVVINESYPTQTATTDPLVSAEPGETEEEIHFSKARRRLSFDGRRGEESAGTKRGSQGDPFLSSKFVLLIENSPSKANFSPTTALN
ncbi:MAG: hypothetical protein Q9160_003784 [Pyrenula sp. 1 TL-2023]